MHIDTSTLHNHNEQAVFDRVQAEAPRYPAIAASADLLADVACLALNRLPPRYIRHAVDHSFYLGELERQAQQAALAAATAFAFDYVQARLAAPGRERRGSP